MNIRLRAPSAQSVANFACVYVRKQSGLGGARLRLRNEINATAAERAKSLQAASLAYGEETPS